MITSPKNTAAAGLPDPSKGDARVTPGVRGSRAPSRLLQYPQGTRSLSRRDHPQRGVRCISAVNGSVCRDRSKAKGPLMTETGNQARLFRRFSGHSCKSTDTRTPVRRQWILL